MSSENSKMAIMRDLTPTKSSGKKHRKQARGATPRGVYYFEESIEKFATAAATVTTQLASHAQRMDTIDAMSNRFKDDIKDLRREQSTDNQFLHQRIDTVQRDLTEKLAAESHALSQKLDGQTTQLTQHIDSSIEKMGETVGEIQGWRFAIRGVWLVGGTAVTAGLMRLAYLAVASPVAQAWIDAAKHFLGL